MWYLCGTCVVLACYLCGTCVFLVWLYFKNNNMMSGISLDIEHLMGRDLCGHVVYLVSQCLFTTKSPVPLGRQDVVHCVM